MVLEAWGAVHILYCVNNNKNKTAVVSKLSVQTKTYRAGWVLHLRTLTFISHTCLRQNGKWVQCFIFHKAEAIRHQPKTESAAFSSISHVAVSQRTTRALFEKILPLYILICVFMGVWIFWLWQWATERGQQGGNSFLRSAALLCYILDLTLVHGFLS